MYLSRREGNGQASKVPLMFAPSAQDLSEWGAVLEFLTEEQWPGGDSRRTGTLLLFVDEGRLKLCLSDRDQGLVGFVTGSSILDALRNAESALREDRVDWRASRSHGPGRRKGQ